MLKTKVIFIIILLVFAACLLSTFALTPTLKERRLTMDDSGINNSDAIKNAPNSSSAGSVPISGDIGSTTQNKDDAYYTGTYFPGYPFGDTIGGLKSQKAKYRVRMHMYKASDNITYNDINFYKDSDSAQDLQNQTPIGTAQYIIRPDQSGATPPQKLLTLVKKTGEVGNWDTDDDTDLYGSFKPSAL